MNNFVVLSIIASIAVISIIGVQNASAHQSALLPGNDHINNIVFVIGHVDEPTFGNNPGIHEGKHGLELYIRDEATRLMIPQGSTELMFDKYYFEDVAAYNAATSLDDATQAEFGIPINQAYGKPGNYIHRQIIQDGIYGYHVYGTVDYYGVGHRDVDVTFFCGRVAGMNDPSKFENVLNGTTRGEFGCPQPTQNIDFPRKDGHSSHTSGMMDDTSTRSQGKMGMSMKDYGATSVLSDGTKIMIGVSQPIVGERSEINVMFKDAQHINYDIIVKQGSLTVLNEVDVHDHDGMYEHKTIPLRSTDPFNIILTFDGYGMGENKRPFNEVLTFSQVMPTMKGDKMDKSMKKHGKMDHGDHGDMKMSSMSMTPDATDVLSDGTKVMIGVSQPIVGERSEINVMFKDAQHVNYDIIVKQGSLTVLNEVDVHDHDGMYEHKTIPLTSTSPFDIIITFQGYGMEEIKRPPVNESVRFTQVMPTIDGN